MRTLQLMAVPLLTPQTLPGYIERLGRITRDGQRRWGSMSAAAMLAHVRFFVNLSLEPHDHPDISSFLSRTLGRWLAFHVFTRWPGGRIKAPDYTAPSPEGDLEAERQRVAQALQRFVDEAEREPQRIGVSPIFGPMPLRTWRRVHACHLEHHLRQFGV